MELVLAHRNMDFDCLASQLAVSKLHPAARIVPAHPLSARLKSFLALYRDRLPLVDLQYVDWQLVKHVYIVDCQRLDRLDERAQRSFLEYRKHGRFTIFDHHESDSETLLSQASEESIVKVTGSAASILVEKLKQLNVKLNSFEATLIAAGIYEDTGCLTHKGSTEVDAMAIAYCLGQGADLERINEIIRPKFDEWQAGLFEQLLSRVENLHADGARFSICIGETDRYIDGLSEITSRLLENTASDALVSIVSMKDRVHLVARSNSALFDLRGLVRLFGGGGHAGAVSAVIKGGSVQQVRKMAVESIASQLNTEKTASQVMSSPVRTIGPEISMEEAGRIMLRHSLDGLVVMDKRQIAGMVSKRDVDKARHHKLAHAPVCGFMSHPVFTVNTGAKLSEIQATMVAEDIGRLPVVDENGQLVGIVGRHELLTALYGEDEDGDFKAERISPQLVIRDNQDLLDKSDAEHMRIYRDIGEIAAKLNMVAYLVGGCVRDLILDRPNYDLDFVVEGSARELARALVEANSSLYSAAAEHERFNTATLYFLGKQRREIDIATARTEYYEYPAALPTVEPSSLEQDLFRRDFSINALAICLHPRRFGELVDYFNGLGDLKSGIIRILHPFSFIEDPTRIVRAARFAARLNFVLDTRSKLQAQRAIALGIFDNLGGIRLKEELRYILESESRIAALDLLNELGGGLRFLDADVVYDLKVRLHVRRAERLLKLYPLPSPFVLYLGVLVYGLPAERLEAALKRLQLADEERDCIVGAQVILQGLMELNPSARRSQIYHVLHGYNVHSLAIAACVAPLGSNLRRSLRLYFEELKDIKVQMRGDDLIKLGVKVGPNVGMILSRLRDARIDGELSSFEDERDFVLSKFRDLLPGNACQ